MKINDEEKNKFLAYVFHNFFYLKTRKDGSKRKIFVNNFSDFVERIYAKYGYDK